MLLQDSILSCQLPVLEQQRAPQTLPSEHVLFVGSPHGYYPVDYSHTNEQTGKVQQQFSHSGSCSM